MSIPVRSSREYGWLVVSRETYERLLVHDYAGPESDAPGLVWVLGMDEDGATVLWKGVRVEEFPV